jgi:hypothetical protein
MNEKNSKTEALGTVTTVMKVNDTNPNTIKKKKNNLYAM